VYVIKSDTRNAYKTSTGWTTITRDGKNAVLNGLNDVLRFTERESHNSLPKGCRFVYFPRRRWKDL
jgi:hypothetical protein